MYVSDHFFGGGLLSLEDRFFRDYISTIQRTRDGHESRAVNSVRSGEQVKMFEVLIGI